MASAAEDMFGLIGKGCAVSCYIKVVKEESSLRSVEEDILFGSKCKEKKFVRSDTLSIYPSPLFDRRYDQYHSSKLHLIPIVRIAERSLASQAHENA